MANKPKAKLASNRHPANGLREAMRAKSGLRQPELPLFKTLEFHCES